MVGRLRNGLRLLPHGRLFIGTPALGDLYLCHDSNVAIASRIPLQIERLYDDPGGAATLSFDVLELCMVKIKNSDPIYCGELS